MMAERGISLAHTTIMRWIARYVPEFEKRWNGIDTLTDQWGSACDKSSGHEAHFLCPPSISAPRHPARCLVLSPVYLSSIRRWVLKFRPVSCQEPTWNPTSNPTAVGISMKW